MLKLQEKLKVRYSIRLMLGLLTLAAGWLACNDYLSRRVWPLPVSWDFGTGKNVKWIAELGSQTYANPTIHKGKVFVGTNNGSGYDSNFPSSVDLGVMLCFDAKDGSLLWQHSNQKLAVGRSQDWPLQGVSSQAFADRDRLWYVSNRCEVVCLDTEGFYDDQNDGVKSEVSVRKTDADVVWKVDMRKRFGVFPHNASHCNVVVDRSRVYVKTSNGVGPDHKNLPAPNAPSFVVLDRKTGKTIWADNSPKHIAHGSWGSPALATIAGKQQVLFPGGDGWLYSFEPAGDGNGGSVLLWKFDCNPKTSKNVLSGRGTRNNLLTAPTVHDDKVYITMGQDPEHGIGPSFVWCISPGALRGDISPTLVNRSPSAPAISFENGFQHCNLDAGDIEVPNPNSGLAWKYAGYDSNGDGKVNDSDSPLMNRSLSEVRIRNGRAYVNDMEGILHCIDAANGNYLWHHKTLSTVWNSPLVTDDAVYVGNEDGEVIVLSVDETKGKPLPIELAKIETPKYNSVYATPTGHKGVLYLVTRTQLIAIEESK